MSDKDEKIRMAKKLVAERLSGENATAKRKQFVQQAREEIKPLLQAVRAAEQITADDRRVYINVKSED